MVYLLYDRNKRYMILYMFWQGSGQGYMFSLSHAYVVVEGVVMTSSRKRIAHGYGDGFHIANTAFISLTEEFCRNGS